MGEVLLFIILVVVWILFLKYLKKEQQEINELRNLEKRYYNKAIVYYDLMFEKSMGVPAPDGLIEEEDKTNGSKCK